MPETILEKRFGSVGVIRFHEENLKYKPQIRLLRNWLSYAVSCDAADSRVYLKVAPVRRSI
jgi:hypothetical protein